MDEDEFYETLRRRRLVGLVVGLGVLAGCLVGAYFLLEWMLASAGLQRAPAAFFEAQEEAARDPVSGTEDFAHGHVAVWTGESQGEDELKLPAHEITVEDYRLKGLSRVGRPSATQERLSTDLFIVVNDDPGDLVLRTMGEAGVYPIAAHTFTVLVRDRPGDWETKSLFDPVTVTVTVPDDLVESAFVDDVVVYAVYNKQYPDAPGGLATLPVSVTEEDGLCYASFLVTEDYEAEYAMCPGGS